MYIRDFSSLQNEPLTPAGSHRAAVKLPRDVISAIFALLDSENIAWCIAHGYDGLPETYGTDIDCIVDSKVTPERLISLFAQNEREIGARLVLARGYFITLACSGHDGMPVLLSLDFSIDYCFGNHLICTGTRILQTRRRHRNFWIASPEVEFSCSLPRLLMNQRLDAGTAHRLSSLFIEAPEQSRIALANLWPQRATELANAAASGEWQSVIPNAVALRRELKALLVRRSPGRFMMKTMRTQLNRLGRLLRPPGINVVLLGPDGAGKSSTIDALEKAMAPIFARTEVRGFAPSLRQLLKRPPPSTSTPHALKPRSLPTSLVRAGYWTLHGTLGYASIYWAKVKSTLVLNDRHYVDILVDPVRYRYGGPRWLLKVIWNILPKPDLIILLYGPAEVLQARKRELTVEETARQCRDYLALVKPMQNSHIVDATQPFDQVVQTVTGIVLQRMGRPTPDLPKAT
jgi:thymidylate kinase